MKFVLIAALALLASCSHKPSRITFTEYDSLHTGRIVVGDHTIAAVDTNYTVEPSDAIKNAKEKQHGQLWFVLLGVVILIACTYFLILRRSDSSPAKPFAYMGCLLACAAITFGSIDWYRSNAAIVIKKPIYDSVIKSDGTIDKYLASHIR